MARGFSANDMSVVIKADGQHSEWFWRREFPTAYQWLFAQMPTSILSPAKHTAALNVYPNPSNEYLLIAPPTTSPYTLELHNSLGVLVLSQQLNGYNKIPVTHLPNGVYRLSYVGDAGLLQKMVVIQY